jgi:hypothetical protein
MSQSEQRSRYVPLMDTGGDSTCQLCKLSVEGSNVILGKQFGMALRRYNVDSSSEGTQFHLQTILTNAVGRFPGARGHQCQHSVLVCSFQTPPNLLHARKQEKARAHYE